MSGKGSRPDAEKKPASWETARILGIKRGAYKRRQEKQEALAAEIRTLEKTLKALRDAGE